MTNQQQGKQFVSIQLNRLESTTFFQGPDQLHVHVLRLAQTDFRQVKSTEGDTILVDLME